MNNNIIKRLRRTLLCTVAAAAVAIGFTACADETLTTQNTTAPVNGNGYKFSIPANMGGGGTRAIAYNGTDGYDATFETSEMIFVFDVTKNAVGVKKEEWGGYSNTYLYPDANAKTANLVGELSFTVYDRESGNYGDAIAPAEGDELILFYNNDNDVFRYNHNENDYYLNNSGDYALATVKITSIGDDGVIKTSPASFENLQSIYKINFTGIEPGVKIKKVDIRSEKNQLVSYYFAFRKEKSEDFSVVNYTYEGEGTDQHELTFMLRYSDNPDYYENSDNPSTSGDVFSFTALGSNGHNYLGQKEVTTELKNGVYYQANIEMTDLGEAMKVRNITKGETLDPSTYYKVYTANANYLAEYNGYGSCIEWYGGIDDQYALTLSSLTMFNGGDGAIAVKADYDDPDNSKVHRLVLVGENTLSVGGQHTSLTVQDGNSLIISGTGQLTLIAPNSPAFGLWDNAKVTIESGEVIVDGKLGVGENSSCVIAKDGKLRALTSISTDEYYYSLQTGGIKAASGYVLVTEQDGDYTVFTVKEADPYVDPKPLAQATKEDAGKIVGSDGYVHVLHWDLPEGVSPVGMLASISETGKGLVIAKKIIVKKFNEWGGYGTSDYFSWDSSREDNDGKTATEIFQEWANNNEVSFGTWRIPTKADGQNMILGCRIDGDATEPSDENMISNGFKSKLKEAGICADDYLYFWTNTQWSDDFNEGMFVFAMNKMGNDSFATGFYGNSADSGSAIYPVLEFGY